MSGLSNNKSVFLTGFGPFGTITDNPSTSLVRALKPALEQKSIMSKILSLPVSYVKAPILVDNVLNNQKFDLILGFGLHRGEDFRFEITARPKPVSQGLDCEGKSGEFFQPINSSQLYTSLNADFLVEYASREITWLRKSTDASGYVCEAIYHRLLSHAVQTHTACGFIHIPAFKYYTIEKQQKLTVELIESILQQLN